MEPLKRIFIYLSVLMMPTALASPLQQSFLIDPEPRPQQQQQAWSRPQPQAQPIPRTPPQVQAQPQRRPVTNVPPPAGIATPPAKVEAVAKAPSWSLPPLQHSISVDASTEYDTNPAMASENIKGVSVATVTPRYQVKYVKGVDEVTASAQVTAVRSSDQDLVIDREDPAASIGWKRELRRGEISANAVYDRESTSSSEPTTSGASGSNDTRAHYGVSAALKYEITQRLEGDISISKDFNTYSTASGLASGFNDYETTTTVASLTYLLSQRNAVYTTASASKYTPDAPAAESTTNYTGVVGIRSALTPNLTADANIGAAQLDTSGSPTSVIGSASLTHTGKRTTSSLSYSRSSSSSGSSSFTQTDDYSASVTYAVDDRSNVGASASLSQTVSETPTSSSSVEVFADRQLMRDLKATASYQYRKNEDETSEAEGSTVMLSVNYELPDL